MQKLITMQVGMTTDEAVGRFQCSSCQKGEECDEAGHGGWCVESSTCSMRCYKCGERVWFQGSWGSKYGQVPENFTCPGCGANLEYL